MASKGQVTTVILATDAEHANWTNFELKNSASQFAESHA